MIMMMMIADRIQGGVLHPWNSAAVIAPIVVAGVSFIILGFWEVYAPLKHPILPPRLFRQWREYVSQHPLLLKSWAAADTNSLSFTIILVIVFVAGMLYYSNLILWPRISSLLFLQSNDTIMRGLYANMTSFATILAAVYLNLVMPWIKHERWQLVGLATMQTAMIGALSSIDLDSKARTIVFLILAGASSTSTSVLIFGMISLLLEDQADM